ncbi:MAG: hypothetical protein ACP5PQ_05320 [Thermoproteota archaeon]
MGARYAVLESREMLNNEEMMNKFLISRGIEPSPAPRVTGERLKIITAGVAGKLRDVLFEKFKEDQHLWKIEFKTPSPKEKWWIAITRSPYNIFIDAYVDGRIEVGIGSVDHWDGIRDVIWIYKYDWKLKKAKTEEERGRIRQEEEEFEHRAFDDFNQRKYEKYLNDRALNYTARRHIWANEVASRLSSKYGWNIEFWEGEKPGFGASFDSTGMSDERVIDEILRRVDAMLEVGMMLDNEEMMNEFLIGRGIEPLKSRRRRRAS